MRPTLRVYMERGDFLECGFQFEILHFHEMIVAVGPSTRPSCRTLSAIVLVPLLLIIAPRLLCLDMSSRGPGYVIT